MTTHVNADGSISDGVKVEAWGSVVGGQYGLSVASATALTVPAGAIQAIVQADGADVRMRLDGTNPTTTVGFLIKNGTTQTLSAADATAAKFIGTSASVNVIYTL